jgi:hypothetical protein
VLLIPTREEYDNAGLGCLMWWNSDDYSKFKDSAVTEIKNLMLVDERIDCKTAQILLYQPASDYQKNIKSKLTKMPNPRDSILLSKSSVKHVSSSDEELKDDSIDCHLHDITHPLLEDHNDSIPLTHIRSQVDLRALIEGSESQDEENHPQPHQQHHRHHHRYAPSSSAAAATVPTGFEPGFLKIHSPDKKPQYKCKSKSKAMYGDSYSLAGKIPHAHATSIQHAIHPLAYLCS